MNIDIAGDVDAARNVTCVVLARRVQFRRDRRHIVVLPDGVAAADCQPVWVCGDPHGFGKSPKVGIESAAVAAHQDRFTGLVRGDNQADLKLIKEGRQIRGVYAT